MQMMTHERVFVCHVKFPKGLSKAPIHRLFFLARKHNKNGKDDVILKTRIKFDLIEDKKYFKIIILLCFGIFNNQP